MNPPIDFSKLFKKGVQNAQSLSPQDTPVGGRTAPALNFKGLTTAAAGSGNNPMGSVATAAPQSGSVSETPWTMEDSVNEVPGKSREGMRAADVANIGMGIGGAIAAFANKKPSPPKLKKLELKIRPVTGDPHMVNSANNMIDRSVNQGQRMIRTQGSSTGAYLRGMLGLTANAQDAKNKVLFQNSRVMEGQRERNNQLENMGIQYNTGLENQQRMQSFALDRQDFERRRERNEGMVQNAMNYETARQANLDQNKAAVEAGNRQVMMLAEIEAIRQETEWIKQFGVDSLPPEKRQEILNRFRQHQAPVSNGAPRVRFNF